MGFAFTNYFENRYWGEFMNKNRLVLLIVFVLLAACNTSNSLPKTADVTHLPTASTTPSTTPSPTLSPTATNTPTPLLTATKVVTSFVVDGKCDEWSDDFIYDMQKTGILGAKNINVYAMENKDSFYVCVEGLEAFLEVTIMIEIDEMPNLLISGSNNIPMHKGPGYYYSEPTGNIEMAPIGSELVAFNSSIEFRISLDELDADHINLRQMEFALDSGTSGIVKRAYFYSRQESVVFADEIDPVKSSNESDTPPITNIKIDGNADDWVDKVFLEEFTSVGEEGFLDLTGGTVFSNQDAIYFYATPVDPTSPFIKIGIEIYDSDGQRRLITWKTGHHSGLIGDTTSDYVFIGRTEYSIFAFGDVLEGRIDFQDIEGISQIARFSIHVLTSECRTIFECSVADEWFTLGVPRVYEIDPPTISNDIGNIPEPANLPFDMDSGCIKMVAAGFDLKKVMDSPFGLPAQIALLPEGELVISEYGADAISVIDGNTIHKLISDNYLLGQVVATLPDGRIAYSPGGYGVNLVDPKSGEISTLAFKNGVSALASDQYGYVYAASYSGNVYKIDTANNHSKVVAKNLPFGEGKITDMDVTEDGTIYVAGNYQVIAITEGSYSVIAPNLNNEPVWVSVAPGGMVYINDVATGLQRYNPITKQLIRISRVSAFGDIIAPSDTELIFLHWRGSYYRYDFTNGRFDPYYISYSNSHAFAADGNGNVFFISANIHDVHNTNVMSVNVDGDIIVHDELSYKFVPSADFDFDQNLCLATDQGFHCYKNGELVKAIISSNNSERLRTIRIAMGPEGLWYFIVSNRTNNIQVYRMDETGKVTTLPITFSLSSFGGAYKVSMVNLDVGHDGRLAIIVTAKATKNDGPFYQRVYRADSDGRNLLEIANLDSDRIAGLVDIAIAPNNDIYVLNVQGGINFYADPIYRIDENNIVHPFVDICGGHDPKSIDVDLKGNLWFSTTTGIFQVVPQPDS